MKQGIFRLIRPALVLLAVFLVIALAGVAYQGVRTLQTLTTVEADRDQWQRPSDVIRNLNLKDGSVVVDFGSGAGYFALKLADLVGSRGRVVAVDLRRLSLLFLRIRAFLQRKPNIRIIVGDPDDPRLTPSTVDSILISNTYHELAQPQSILRHLSTALRPAGRLVIIDRTEGREGHGISPGMVEAALRREGFEIVIRDDNFTQSPDNDSWWLIVAAKP
jgi:ubiquinone/menaquinone biosynthesis C-methylase UbiE